MTVKQIQAELQQSLQIIYDEREAKNIAEWVVEHITGKKRIDRLMDAEKAISTDEQQKFFSYRERLLQQEPVQYVLNEAWFYGMKLYVDKNVLIPRPETEELVSWVIETVKHWPTPAVRNYKIIDVGTGSGCIPIALKKNLPGYFECWACDKSDAALTVARRNADEQQALVDFVPLDFLLPAERNQLPHTDILVSNPPYIPLSGKNEMKDNVVRYEPSIALFVPDEDPLLFYKALAVFGKDKLHPGGLLFVEIHEDLGDEVVALFEAAGYKNVQLKKDMQERNRMVLAAI